MRERPEDRRWRAGALALAVYGLLVGGWTFSIGLNRSLSDIDLLGDDGSDGGIGELFLLIGFVVFVAAPKVGAIVSRRAPERHARHWLEALPFVLVLLPDWGDHGNAAKLFLVVAGIASLAVRPQRWDHRIAGLVAGSAIAAAFGNALHPGLWIGAAALVLSELVARPHRPPPVAPDYDVELVWKEIVVYWEGERGYCFQGGWGVEPLVTYVPGPGDWDAVVPEWLRGRRREVLERLASLDGHVLRPAPPGLFGAEATMRRYP